MAKSNRILTADQLVKPKTKEVEIPGGVVVIRAMSAGYALALRGKELNDDAIFKMIADLVAEPKLTPEQVAEMNMDDVTALTREILTFNGIGDDDIKKAEEQLKNAQTEGSTTS